MSASTEPARGPRPVVAFFVSLAASALVLALLLISDSRVLELKRARAELRELDERIAALERANVLLRAGIEAARRHEFPAEKTAREELHLVAPDEIVLLYPPGSLTKEERPASSPAPRRSSPAP